MLSNITFFYTRVPGSSKSHRQVLSCLIYTEANTMKDFSFKEHETDANFDAFDLRSESPSQNSR